MGIASIVLGILGLLSVLVEPTLGLVFGLIGAALGGLSLQSGKGSRGVGIVGVAVSLVAVVGVVALILFASGTRSGVN